MSYGNIKNLINSREKWFFLTSIPFNIFIIYKFESINPNKTLPKIFYLFILTGYFTYKSIYQMALENSYRNKYKGLSEIFNKKVQVINVINDKATNNITYTLHSFLPKSNIERKIDELSHYLNTNIISIKQNKQNFKLIYINTNKFLAEEQSVFNKNSIENKLLTILKFYEFNPEFISKEENEFLILLKIKCLADIKKVFSKQQDIASKLKLATEDLTVKVELDYFVFEVSKRKNKIFHFEDYIDEVNIDKKFEIPFILGINQKTGKVIVEDLVILLHTLIAGTSGGGKSSFFNCLIQSAMYFGCNASFIMVDFKRIELNQYKDFNNTIFIKEQDVFLKVLKKLNIEMERRYNLFEKEGVKKIQSYNLKKKKKLPYIIVCIDELADLRVNSNDELTKAIEDILMRLLNMARACGILIVCATQRPSSKQLNTDIRDRLDTKISFKVSIADTQRMIGVMNTEKLKVGEFIIISEKYNNVKFKSLFIDEDDNRNSVYEKLLEYYGGYIDVSYTRKEEQLQLEEKNSNDKGKIILTKI
jgi:hypothetical protein